MDDMDPLDTVRQNRERFVEAQAAEKARKEEEKTRQEEDKAAQRAAEAEERARQDVERAGEVLAIANDILIEIATYYEEVKELDVPGYDMAMEISIPNPRTWKQRIFPGLFRPTATSKVAWMVGSIHKQEYQAAYVDIDGVPYLTTSERPHQWYFGRSPAVLTRERLETLSFTMAEELLEAVQSQRKHLETKRWLRERNTQA
jgi:hypothetical protein